MFDQGLGVTVLLLFNWMVLAYFIGINSAYFALLFISYFELLRHSSATRNERWRRILQSPLTLPVSVLAPAYNEEVPIVESVRSLLMLQYPRMEIVVVNDGSSDRTLEVLIQNFGLVKIPTQVETTLESKPIKDIYRSSDYPILVVVDKENGGKADALNAGINVSRYPLVCAIYADSLIEGGALLRVVRPFLEKPRTTVAQTQGWRRSRQHPGCLVPEPCRPQRRPRTGRRRPFLQSSRTRPQRGCGSSFP